MALVDGIDIGVQSAGRGHDQQLRAVAGLPDIKRQIRVFRQEVILDGLHILFGYVVQPFRTGPFIGKRDHEAHPGQRLMGGQDVGADLQVVLLVDRKGIIIRQGFVLDVESLGDFQGARELLFRFSHCRRTGKQHSEA